MSFYKDGLSIDESRVSTVLLTFIPTIGFALWQFASAGHIDGSMLTLVAYQIGAITGMNIVKDVAVQVGGKNKNNKDYSDDEVGG